MSQAARAVAALVLSLSVPVWSGCGNSAAASDAAARGRGAAGGAVPVVTAVSARRDVPVEIAAIGNVEAYETVSLRAQVTGVIQTVQFKEGDTVKAGDPLFTIDPAPFQSLLAQAEANVVRDQALLEQANAQRARDQAQAAYQQLTSERNGELVERGIVSKDVAQQAQAAAAAITATVKADDAAIDSARAQLAAERTTVDNARLQLAYTEIRSPIAGRTGNLTMKPGNLATANVTELVTIAQIQPVNVTFSVPSAHLSVIKRRMATDRLTVTATPQDETSEPVSGVLSFVDNLIDASTDTIKLKAVFDNGDRRLWPGQFARVALQLDTMPGVTVVSTEAVQTGQDGDFVFVVKPDATVEQRPVSVAQRVGDEAVIAKGLKPGETVVTEGQLRLEAGSRVQQ